MKDNLKKIISLLRINQWYKNLLIFIAIFLAGELLNINLFLKIVGGFFVLAFASSSTYIINDIVDIKKDILHPEKKNRVLASGKIKTRNAKIISGVLLIFSLFLAFLLKPLFVLFPIILFLSTNLYTFYFKNYAIIDLYFIAFNHVLRAVAGAFLISVSISSWFILFIFLLAMFLAIGKKRADLFVLGKNAKKHKKVYEIYNKKFIDWLIIILLNSLFMSYILYTFMAYESKYFMLTIPFASFLIFRYLYFVSVNHKIARKTEYIFLDKQMIVGLLLWFISAFITIYLVGA